MIAAGGSPEIVEGVPWWVTLIVLPVLGVVIAAARKWLRLDPQATAGTTPPPTEGPRPMPVTSDEKLDATRELIVELRTQRDRLAREVDELNVRHEQELDAMRVRHQLEMAQIQQQVQVQDQYIRRIEGLLGVQRHRQPEAPTNPL